MKQPFREGRAHPGRVYHHPPRTEPAVWDADFGSSALSSADCKYLTENASRLIVVVDVHTKSPNADDPPADAKGETRGTAGGPARRMPRCPDRGRWVGAVGTGGRVHAATARRSADKRHCGSGGGGGSESSPSAGWREVAAEMDATGGMGHR